MTAITVVTPRARPEPDEDLVDALARVHVRGWQGAYGSSLPERFYGEEAYARRREMWRGTLAHELAPERVRIAHSDAGQVIGFSIHGPSRDEDFDGLELFAIYVLSEHHGTGAGQALLDASIGTEPATLWVAEDNSRARCFYEKNGFTPDGTRRADPDLGGLAEVRLAR